MRILVSWSGGKDATLALHRLRPGVVGLYTTLRDNRVAIHEVPAAWLARQADALGLPWHSVGVGARNETYADALREFYARQRAEGVTHVAFGDIFLDDVRAFKEALVAEAGLAALFPLWGAPTVVLSNELLAAGYRAVVCSLDGRRLPAAQLGQPFDAAFLSNLPAGVDPGGERGEFHTFAHGGPGWAVPLPAFGRARQDLPDPTGGPEALPLHYLTW